MSAICAPPSQDDDTNAAGVQLPNAATTREGDGLPNSAASHRLVSARAGKSTPVSMPRPSSIQTRSSVAKLPVADLAYGQPPSPPADESNSVIPASSPTRTFANACP